MDYIASLKVLQNRKASFDSDSDMNKILGFAEKFADECGISRGRKKAYPHIDEMDNNVVVSFDTLYDTLPRGIELPDGKGSVTVIIYQNPLNKEYVVDMGIFTKGSMEPLSAKFVLNQKDLESYEDFRRDLYNGLKEAVEKLTERYTGKTSVKAVRNRKAKTFKDDGLRYAELFAEECGMNPKDKGYPFENTLDGITMSLVRSTSPEGLEIPSGNRIRIVIEGNRMVIAVFTQNSDRNYIIPLGQRDFSSYDRFRKAVIKGLEEAFRKESIPIKTAGFRR